MTGRTKEKQKSNNKLRSRSGMTMAEMLTTVAIILILAGVVFITLSYYQRSLAQTERDGIAKEIFIAAQNHLTMARGEGYLGITETVDDIDYTNDKTTVDQKKAYNKVYGRPGNWEGDTGVRYFIVNGKDGDSTASDFTTDNSSILDLMLPFGSVDETVRLGGSYIIRYQPKTGTVLDVFYCSVSGSPERFNHYLTTNEYGSLADMVDTETKDESGKVTVVSRKKDRRYYTDGSVLGWYGGAEAAKLKSYSFKAPTLDLVNGDTLYAEVTNNEIKHATDTKIRLIITGVTSGARAAFKMDGSDLNAGDRLLINSSDEISWDYIFTLDDITRDGLHFADLAGQTPLTEPVGFIPGEDVRVEAVVYSNKVLGIAYSGVEAENSLFESIAETSEADVRSDKTKMYAEGTKHAYIGSIRHLENLYGKISNVGSGSKPITVAAASQTKDLYWADHAADNITGFKSASQYTGNNKGRGTGGIENVNEGGVVDLEKKDADGYYPVDNSSDLKTYDGLRHSIYYVETASNYGGDETLNAGLFGTASCKIKNLALIDFKMHGSGSVGALAGVSADTVLNVAAYNSNDENNGHEDDPEAATIVSSGGAAGGLIGSMTGGKMQYCGAALVVEGSSAAGGLIGEVISNANLPIEASYSGGHTIRGEYYKHKKNSNGDYTGERETEKVTVKVNDKDIEKDVPVGLYNVSAGSNGSAGGLIGSVSNADIRNCYSTCSVEGDAAKSGGFVGVISGSSVNHCYCTGLVSGGWKKNNKNEWELPANAFLGTCDSTTRSSISNAAGQNHYYEIINEFGNVDGGGMSCKEPGDDKVEPIDKDKAVYNSFVAGINTWNPAVPYDGTLRNYYKNSSGESLYNLKTVTQLEATLNENGGEKSKTPIDKSGNPQEAGSLFVNTHFGDWPAPEVFIINN